MSQVDVLENAGVVAVEPKLTLRLTRGQASAVLEACNVLSDLGTGRFKVIAGLIASGVVPMRREYDGDRVVASQEKCELISGLLRDAARQIGYWERRVNEVSHPHTAPVVKRAWEAGQAIAEALLACDDQSDMDAPLSIAMSLDQAHGLAYAAEALARIGIGQIEFVGELVRMGVVPVYKGAEEQRELAQHEAWDRVESVMSAIKQELGFHPNASNGIGHPHNSLNVTRSWEVHKVIRQALAMHRNPSPSFRSVDYDGISVLRWTKDPAPVATIT